MITVKHFFRFSGINNCQLFIVFCQNYDIIFSDGSVIRANQEKWNKSNCNIGKYIKLVLNVNKSLVTCDQRQLLDDTVRWSCLAGRWLRDSFGIIPVIQFLKLQRANIAQRRMSPLAVIVQFNVPQRRTAQITALVHQPLNEIPADGLTRLSAATSMIQ